MTGAPDVPTFGARATRGLRVLFGVILVWVVVAVLVAAWADPEAGTVAGLLAVVATAASMLLVMAAFHRVALEVHADRVVVRYGSTPWRTTVALADVRDVRAVELSTWSHGGFGHRGSRRLTGRAAVKVRSGEAVEMDLADGSTLVVTVDDAEGAATAIRRARGEAA